LIIVFAFAALMVSQSSGNGTGAVTSKSACLAAPLRALVDGETILHEDLIAWKKEDFLTHRGWVRFLSPDLAEGLQRFREISSFSKDEQSLIRSLSRRGRAPKFTHGAALRQYQKNAAELEGLEQYQKGHLTQSQISELLYAEVETNKEVEVGAWRITLKSGRVLTAFHTSKRHDNLDPGTFLAAMYGVIKRDGFLPQDISELQYFHNHPPGDSNVAIPISAGDESIAHGISQLLRKVGATCPVHIYAVSEIEKDWVTFELTVP
jgi:hypothetical protein